MKVNKSLDQHIAVFGESGSGKTVLLSSFYGPTQEPGYAKENLFEVIAESTGQGMRLHQNYLGMRNDARVPEPNRFVSHSYAFRVTPKKGDGVKAPVDSLRLVWHDYPGEWFEQDTSSDEEAERRVDTFRSLLSSDVAFLLVDAQRLVDNAGEEERYLKSLFTNFRNGFAGLKDAILLDGEPLVEFPRIWVVALSKADLLPDLDVYGFQELVIGKAAGELNRLGETIGEMVQGKAALSVGEDFVLFSSAKFTSGKIDLTERVGLDLILPIAAMLPFERHAKWAEAKLVNKIPDAVVGNLVGGANVVAGILLAKKIKLPGPIGVVVGLLSGFLTKDVVDGLLNMAKGSLEAAKNDAIQKKEYFTAVLTGFRLALVDAEERRVLRLSRR
ncbi:TRAFAC clade GTPase domain-containing protein [Microbacterium sp.]|uniref:TRAFAC clade GTPase domain-containing protein n=1 Tax=Microbacterium sp. TaxID=51671 RepID=UPI0039E43E00